MIGIAFFCAAVACAMFALTQQRHRRQLFLGVLTQSQQGQRRCLASVLLMVALAICCTLRGPLLGVLFWLGALSVSGLATALVLAYLPPGLTLRAKNRNRHERGCHD